jgi:hypothetical protein
LPLKTAALSLSREEAGDDVGAFDSEVRVGGQAEAGVVVEEVEDLDVGAVGQLPVGSVDLPHLVGEVGLEAYEGAAGALLGLGNDAAVAGEDAPDG